jgi:hypothetical protein
MNQSSMYDFFAVQQFPQKQKDSNLDSKNFYPHVQTTVFFDICPEILSRCGMLLYVDSHTTLCSPKRRKHEQRQEAKVT